MFNFFKQANPSRSQALPGNLYLAALPPIQYIGSRAAFYAFPGRAGRAWERSVR